VATSVCATSDSARSIVDERAAASREPIRAKASFDVVYSSYVEFVWRSAQRLGVEESAADDVVQQVFLIVHQSLGAFKWRSTLKTWLFGILLRVVRDHWRVTRRKSPHLAHESVDPDILANAALNPDEALSRAEASRMIDILLYSLEGDKRVVFVMADLEGMTATEIGVATGLAPNAVYSRLRAARTDFERAAAAMRRRERRGCR
jgi:RNA polymerase sigma-70 factor, ECF subfamily